MAETIPMGIGNLGFSNALFKRKFRFTFEVENICGGGRIPAHYVKIANRPKLSIEETPLNFLNGKSWIPGKGEWEPINITYYDVATQDVGPLFSWLASVFNFTDPNYLNMGTMRYDYAATGILKIWSGCGDLIEIWELIDLWPNSIDFGELDYSSSDVALIDLTLRYSNVRYTPVCPEFAINTCCTPCGPISGILGDNVIVGVNRF